VVLDRTVIGGSESAESNSEASAINFTLQTPEVKQYLIITV
jgi:hypothetical protein